VAHDLQRISKNKGPKKNVISSIRVPWPAVVLSAIIISFENSNRNSFLFLNAQIFTDEIMDFELQLNDKTAPIAIDFDKAKNVLLIAFGGLAHKIGVPMFEFNKITSGLKNINKIYVRDKNRLYYHRGLPNVGNNIDSIANYLRQYRTHP